MVRVETAETTLSQQHIKPVRSINCRFFKVLVPHGQLASIQGGQELPVNGRQVEFEMPRHEGKPPVGNQLRAFS